MNFEPHLTISHSVQTNAKVDIIAYILTNKLQCNIVTARSCYFEPYARTHTVDNKQTTMQKLNCRICALIN